MTQENNYKGFSLFNDIEDEVLRNRNRAVVLANISEDNTKNKKITPKGAALVLGYFSQIPAEDRADTTERYKINMQQRGFVING